MKIKLVNENKKLKKIIKEEARAVLKEISLNPLNWFRGGAKPTDYEKERKASGRKIPIKNPDLFEAYYDFTNDHQVSHIRGLIDSVITDEEGRKKMNKAIDQGNRTVPNIATELYTLKYVGFYQDGILYDRKELLDHIVGADKAIQRILKNAAFYRTKRSEFVSAHESSDPYPKDKSALRHMFAQIEKHADQAHAEVERIEKYLAAELKRSGSKHVLKQIATTGENSSYRFGPTALKNFQERARSATRTHKDDSLRYRDMPFMKKEPYEF